MRKFYLICMMGVGLMFSGMFSSAQCPAGASTATLNWDNLDYLPRTGNYTAFVTTAMMQTQNFAFGVNRVTIDIPATITTNGENTTNTAETGAFGTGADVEYSGTGAITLTFDTIVRNLQFSIFDIDASQNVRITALDRNGLALNVTVTSVTTGTMTITGSGGTSPLASASGTSIGNTDERASLNISITGNSPAAADGVQSVTITVGGSSGNFWLSDLTACVYGAFPLNYYANLKPWVGQPAYYLVTPDNNSVYMMNPATGVCQWLFSESNSPWINSLSYDGVHHLCYYVMDNPSPLSTNKSLKKYDFNTETTSTIIPDLTAFGIPLFDYVVESAGAAFYNGSLFLGIEGTNSGKTSNRESVIWRIDFDADQNPIRASQAFAWPADNGAGTLTHDWGDFIIKDGMLYDFNTGNVGSTSQYIHFNMQTGANTNFLTGGTTAPIQAGQTWDGTLYWTGGQAPELGRVAKYNENGTIGTKTVATVTVCSPPWAGRAGDASDPFKPKSDFGDAPSSYDPVFNDKATHEYDCNLRLGPTFDREWDKTPSSWANADGDDEDGITTVSVLTSGVSNFVQPIQVYNNTGSNATLIGWLDYNNNGVFDPVEGKSITVSTSGSLQTVNLSWIGIPVPIAAGSTTYLRIRLTNSSNGMTINDPTGWYSTGEVEDYRVPVDFVLPVKMLSFTATNEGVRVALNWVSGKEVNISGFEIERSTDQVNWTGIGQVNAKLDNQEMNSYLFYDEHPLENRSYYRIRLNYLDAHAEYSEVRIIDRRAGDTWIRVQPNPVHGAAHILFGLEKNETVQLTLATSGGITVSRKTVNGVKGMNRLSMEETSGLAAGVYFVKITGASGTMNTKLIVE